jgi:hypothetical protein
LSSQTEHKISITLEQSPSSFHYSILVHDYTDGTKQQVLVKAEELDFLKVELSTFQRALGDLIKQGYSGQEIVEQVSGLLDAVKGGYGLGGTFNAKVESVYKKLRREVVNGNPVN